MDKETKQLVQALREKLESMDKYQREELLIILTDGWCKHCGGNLPCYCSVED
jgi:hypothetical protein